MISSQDLKFDPINIMLPPCLHLVIIMPVLNLSLSLGPFSPFILSFSHVEIKHILYTTA